MEHLHGHEPYFNLPRMALKFLIMCEIKFKNDISTTHCEVKFGKEGFAGIEELAWSVHSWPHGGRLLSW